MSDRYIVKFVLYDEPVFQFSRGKYTVIDTYNHGMGLSPHLGFTMGFYMTEKEAQRAADDLNLVFARKLMIEGTAAEGL